MAKLPACAFRLTLGRRHKKYAPSSYRACITPTQARNLFGQTTRPEPIGCGVFACAFPHRDSDKIVKITRDPSDVAGLIQAQGLAVPKLYSSHKLASPADWTNPYRPGRNQEWPEYPEAYALVLERLQPLVGAEKAVWQKRIKRMQKFILHHAKKREAAVGLPSTAPGKTKVYIYKPPTIGEMAEAVCPKNAGDETRSCQLRIRELNKISADLLARGIDWADLHAGNIGADRNGRWKALDLGATDTPLDQDLPELAGARRRR